METESPKPRPKRDALLENFKNSYAYMHEGSTKIFGTMSRVEQDNNNASSLSGYFVIHSSKLKEDSTRLSLITMHLYGAQTHTVWRVSFDETCLPNRGPLERCYSLKEAPLLPDDRYYLVAGIRDERSGEAFWIRSYRTFMLGDGHVTLPSDTSTLQE